MKLSISKTYITLATTNLISSTRAFAPHSTSSFFGNRNVEKGNLLSTLRSNHHFGSMSTSLQMSVTGLKRVVVTGMGITSCLGNTLDEVKSNLHEAKCGLKFSQEYADYGLKSQVYSIIKF